MLLGAVQGIYAQEPYAVLSDDNTTLTFYYDNNKESRSGMSVGPFTYNWRSGANSGWAVNSGWYDLRENITKVVFDDSFADCTSITSTAYWFYGCSNLTSITGMEKLNTANVIDMCDMFYKCSSLTSLDVSSFNTANVTNMGDMFDECSGLTSLDVSNFNTANVRHMSGMFRKCSGLTSLDVSNFNTAKVTDMMWMFYGCSGLTSLDVSKFNTANVTDMWWMFRECKGLTSLDVSNFNTANVTEMDDMFYGCSCLTSIYCNDSWICNSSNDMFNGCTSLVGAISYDGTKTDVAYANPTTGYFTKNTGGPEPYAVLSDDNTTLTFYYDGNKASHNGMGVGPFDRNYDYSTYTSTVNSGWYNQRESITSVVFDETFADYKDLTSTAYWFYECKNLTTITGIDNLKTDNVIRMYSMFEGCSSLASLDLSNFNTEKVTEMDRMFYNCLNLTSLDLSNFNTENVRYMKGMFNACTSLKSLDVSNFNTKNVTDMNGMFYFCSSLTSLDVSNFNTENVTNMGTMFLGCSGLTSLDLSNFNTENVTTMYNMFTQCYSLTSLDVSNFNTENVKEMQQMFTNCVGLTSLDLSNFDTENVTNMWEMFASCSGLTTIYCNDAWGCESSNGMFYGCTSLKGAISFDSNKTDATYANPTTGYFTKKVSAEVKLKKTSLALVKGKSYTLKATVTPTTLEDLSVTWKSSDERVATVTSSGKVKGVRTGVAVITCTSVSDPSAFATCEVTVGMVSLDKSELAIEKGKTATLKATVYPTSLTDKSVTWESSDTKIATVTSEGKVKGVRTGTATITCTSKATGLSTTCEVTVGLVSLNNSELAIEKGKTATLTATAYPTSLTDKSVTWESSNTKVVSVTSEGTVKGVRTGTATITCTSKATGLIATCEVTVGLVSLNKSELAIEKGKTATLKATVYPSTLEDKTVTWTSSNTAVATVSSKGKVKGVKTGTATITCTSNATGLSTTCEVTVGSVKLNLTEVTVNKGKTVTLKATVYPSTLADKSVTWKSSNKSVATVTTEGKVKGIKAGTATITCTSVATGLSTTCTVTVISTSDSRSLDGDDDELTGLEENAVVVEPFDVYDLSGRKVRHQVTSLDGLPDGVYIVNGKKILKKK